MTATPLFNKVHDLFPLFLFLQLIGDFDDWKELISKDKQLRTINLFIQSNSIKFTKNILSTTLPPKTTVNVKAEFTQIELAFYQSLLNYCLQRINRSKNKIAKLAFEAGTKGIQKLMSNNILVFILRLKQCTNNPSDILEKMDRLHNCKNLVQASEYLQKIRESPEEDECNICFDRISNRIVNPCGHKFCHQCIDKILLKSQSCPYCRTTIDHHEPTKSELIKFPIEPQIELPIVSSKILKISELVYGILDKNEKVVIVSQYINMLTNIKKNIKLSHPNLKYIDINGTISLDQRQNDIQKFQTNPDINVCFLSLTCGSEGINLHSANHLILCDLYWNYAKIDQVMNRIHRINQQKEVYIYKLLIDNTIENKITKMIKKKEILSNVVLNNIISDTELSDDILIIEESIKLIE
jgi:SNF2 family DNA or RNA helicase